SHSVRHNSPSGRTRSALTNACHCATAWSSSATPTRGESRTPERQAAASFESDFSCVIMRRTNRLRSGGLHSLPTEKACVDGPQSWSEHSERAANRAEQQPKPSVSRYRDELPAFHERYQHSDDGSP